MKILVSALLVGLSLSACSNTVAVKQSVESAPKNIIMIVGDGMGPAYTTAYRYFNDDPTTPELEPSVFDSIYVGSASTYPASVSGYITDSAAAATALATGVKSYNSAIGVDVDKNPVLTVLEWAKQQGKKTGVIVTSQINHATPASYLAHNESRRNYDAIADMYFDERINNQLKADVMLGGGQKYFIRDDRNLVEEFQNTGMQYVSELSQLTNLATDKPVLGLFAPVGLPYALDSDDKLRLKTMAQAGIKHLENDKGFFLLLEASQIDWAGHSDDIGAAMGEMVDLAATLTWLKDYVAANPDTLVVLTADHSTGGLTLGRDGIYQWQPEFIKKLAKSPEAIAKQLSEETFDPYIVDNLFGFALSKEEFSSLQAVIKNDVKAMYLQVKHIIDQRTVTGWTTTGHTGVDVPVFAFGKSSELFKGHQDNTDIAKKIFTLLGK